MEQQVPVNRSVRFRPSVENQTYEFQQKSITVPIDNRVWYRFQNLTYAFSGDKDELSTTSHLKFKVTVPSRDLLVRKMEVVLPCRFRFFDKQGFNTIHPNIAPRLNGNQRIFKRCEIVCNGQIFTIQMDQRETDPMLWKYIGCGFESLDNGNRLPVRTKFNHNESELLHVNTGFLDRATQYPICSNHQSH